jgi:mRNA-degrading endonuclease YafQ of YafQ-DinJ toxin-antitoxin module
MLNPSYTNQFKKDLKLMLRRSGKPVEKFKEVANRLIVQVSWTSGYGIINFRGITRNVGNAIWNPIGF